MALFRLLHQPIIKEETYAALVEIDNAMAEGDIKYGLDAWKTGKKMVEDHVAGANRHIFRWQEGEKIDKDSHRRALAHAAARLIIALQLEIDRENRH